MAASRMARLTEFLLASDQDRLVLTLPFIEELIGHPLPASAHRYATWWSNAAPHAGAWVRAGYRVAREGVAPGEVAFLHASANGLPERKRPGRPRRYEPLRDFLEATADATVDLSLAKIEEILGRPLADTASRRAAYWADTAPHSYAWRDAGFQTARLDASSGTIRFTRQETVADASPSAGSPSRP